MFPRYLDTTDGEDGGFKEEHRLRHGITCKCMYVCMCVCMYYVRICIYVCEYKCMYACVYV